MDDEYVARLEKELECVSISKEDREKVIEGFLAVDTNRNGEIDKAEMDEVFKVIGKQPAGHEIRAWFEKYDKNADDKLTPKEFAEIYKELLSDTVAQKFQVAVKTKKGIITKSGATTVEGTQHSYSPEETVAFCDWINQNLKNDPDLKNRLPIDAKNENDFFEALRDGIILCKMINLSQKDTIDERAINKKKSIAGQIHREQENINLALNSARGIGCSLVNIDATDIQDKKAHLILGVLWQVIRIGLFAAFDLQRSPALAVLLKDGEELTDLMNLSPELLLLRWMNYHLLKSAKYQALPDHREITNFSTDIKNSYAYLCLLEQIQPQPEDDEYGGYPVVADLMKYQGTDFDSNVNRARYMLSEADKIGCRAFVTERDVAKGNSKLNMAFVAHLFNTYPCLEEIEREIDIEETKEERTYRNWMNSLGVQPRVNRIYNDLKDGLVFLQLFEIVQPGIVKRKVNHPPFNKLGGRMKKVENCNQAVDLGNEMSYSLVGIGGTDILEGKEKPVLGLTWQLMRGYTMSLLEKLGQKGVEGEPAIIQWVNETLKSGGKSSSISSFSDSKIASSIPVIDLVDVVGGDGTIEYSVVKYGDSEEDYQSNARYAISMARKIGARIYALPDDLWEVKKKMVMTVFTCIMVQALQNKDE